MSLVIECPSCTRRLKVPDELVGSRVKCPTCEALFDAAAPAPAPPPADASPSAEDPPTEPPPVPPRAPLPIPVGVQLRLSLDEEEPASRPADEPPISAPRPSSSSQEEDLRRCPYCNEWIGKKAVRCPYCGEDLDEREDDRPWERPGRYGVRRDWEPHRGTLVMVLGIISLVSISICGLVGLPLGIAAWVMGSRDLRKMQDNVMDPDGRGTTQAGWVCGIIGTILNSLYVLFCLGYFGFIGFMIYQENQSRATRRVTPPPPPVRKFQAPLLPLSAPSLR